MSNKNNNKEEKKNNRIVSYDKDDISKEKGETKRREKSMGNDQMTSDKENDISVSTAIESGVTDYIKQNQKVENDFIMEE